jgi:6-phospho-beta-glucosidase
MRKKIQEIIKDKLPEPYNPDLDDISLSWGGLNHLSWVFDVKIGGKSVMDELLQIITGENFDLSPYYYINKEYSGRNRVIPSPYLRYYTDTEKALKEQTENGLRSNEVINIEENLLSIYKNESIHPVYNLTPEISQRGGADYSRLAVRLIKDIINETSSMEHILNISDETGQFGKTDEFIEAPVSFYTSKNKIIFKPIYSDTSGISGEILDLIGRIRKYESLAVKAGVYQDLSLLVDAAESHPLISGSIHSSSGSSIHKEIIDYMG